MFLGVYTDPNNNLQAWLYYRHDAFYNDTFSPDCNILAVLDFSVSGKDYQEQKENARDKVIEFYNIIQDYSIDFSYNEWNTITSIFEKYGKKYGLTRELKENAII